MTRLHSGISSGRYLDRKSVDQLSIGEYLIRRLQDYGIGARVRHPGRLRAGVLLAVGKKPDRDWSAACARIAPASRPTPMPGCTAWGRCASRIAWAG